MPDFVFFSFSARRLSVPTYHPRSSAFILIFRNLGLSISLGSFYIRVVLRSIHRVIGLTTFSGV